MPNSAQFQQKIVDHFLRNQPTTVAQIYMALYELDNTTNGTSITCGTTTAAGATEVAVTFASGVINKFDLIQFSHDVGADGKLRLYEVKNTLSSSGNLEIHPPLQTAFNTADGVTITRLVECGSQAYGNYQRKEVNFDAVDAQGGTKTDGETLYPAVNQVENGVLSSPVNGRNQIQVKAVAFFAEQNKDANNFLMWYTPANPDKNLDNGDKFSVGDDQGTFTWDYA